MPQTYTVVSGSERVIVHPERSRTGSGGSASARSVHSTASSGGSRSPGSETWSEVGPPYGEEDEIEPSDSASRSRQPSARRQESSSRPAPKRRHSSRRSVLREEVEEEEDPEPPRRHRSSRRHHSSRSSRHRREESRRVPSDESSSTVASHDDYPYGRHGRYPPQAGYRNVPAPAPPPGHGGYAPSVSAAPGYPDPYGGHQALVHLPPPHDPFGYPSSNPFTPQGPQGNPFSPMSAAGGSSYFASEPMAPPMPHHRPPPMPRPQSYMAPPSHYGAEMMSPYGPPSVPAYGPYGMLPPMPGYPPVAGWYPHPGSQYSPAPPPSKEDKKEEVESLKALIQKHEEARVAREHEMIKRAEADAAAIAAAKAKDEEEKKKKEEIAAASKKAKEDAEKKAEEAAKKAKDEHEKKLKEAQEAKDEAEKKQKEVEEEVAKLKPPPDAGKQIKFVDACQRKFNFPFHLCKTWKGMEGLIKQAFAHVDIIGDHVRAGHYDLTGPDGEIMLPQIWEHTIQPDMEISMHMWPIEDEKKKKDKLAEDAALADPFAALGLNDLLIDPSKKPKKKGSKKEKKSDAPNIVTVGPSQPGGPIHPPPGFPPGFPGMPPDPFAGLFPPPISPLEEKKDKLKRPAASKSKSSKEVTGLAAWFAGGSSGSKKKK